MRNGLVEKFGMSEGLAEMWQGLGISAGTAIIVETDVRDKSKFRGAAYGIDIQRNR